MDTSTVIIIIVIIQYNKMVIGGSQAAHTGWNPFNPDTLAMGFVSWHYIVIACSDHTFLGVIHMH